MISPVTSGGAEERIPTRWGKSEWKVKKLRKHRCPERRKEEKREMARRNTESKEISLYRFF